MTTNAPLPRLGEHPQFVPEHLLEGRPHIAVDCLPQPGAVLALSHWPGAGTPAALEDDTSALIAARYLDATDGAHPDAPVVDLVTNDHYDEDGLCALWLLLNRADTSMAARQMAIAAAEAGDFATWTDPWAARVALTVMGIAEPGVSPFPDVARVHQRVVGRNPAGDLYQCILPRVGKVLADPGRFELVWTRPWRSVEADMALLDEGVARIDEVAEADLAIVRTPRLLHDMAVMPRTTCMRILWAIDGGGLVLRHRYETWVRYRSRPLSPRIDLGGLADRLQTIEGHSGQWTADPMGARRPLLYLRGDGGGPQPSSIAPQRLADELVAHLVRMGSSASGVGHA